MRFCLELGHQAWTSGDPFARVENTIRSAKAAESAGFDSIWVTEDPDGWDAFAVLAMLARETSVIRVGTGVVNPFLRHPNLIASSIATLDRISGSRAFLGIGRGQPEWYRSALGMHMVDPLAAVEETVHLLREWNRPPYVASSDGPIEVNSWRRSIFPVGDPPIYIAATGPKMQTLAGRIADGVRFNSLASTDFIASSIKRVRAAAVAAGRDSNALRFFFNPGIRITGDPASALDDLKATVVMIHALPGMDRQLVGQGIELEPVMARVRNLMKTSETLKRGGSFNDIRLGGDLAAAKKAIPDDFILKIAIVGTFDHVRDRLRHLAGLGVTDVFFNIARSPGGIGALSETVERLSIS